MFSATNVFEINKSRYIAIFMAGGSMEKVFSIDFINIYLTSIFFLIDFAGQLSEGSTHVANMLVYDKEI